MSDAPARGSADPPPHPPAARQTVKPRIAIVATRAARLLVIPTLVLLSMAWLPKDCAVTALAYGTTPYTQLLHHVSALTYAPEPIDQRAECPAMAPGASSSGPGRRFRRVSRGYIMIGRHELTVVPIVAARAPINDHAGGVRSSGAGRHRPGAEWRPP